MQVRLRTTGATKAVHWPLHALGLAGLWLLLSACDPSAMLLEVNSTADLPDANPGDGICEATPGMGDCTLRAAVMEANAVPKVDTIDLGWGNTYVLTLAGSGEDAAATGDLDITESVTIKGASIIDGNGTDRVFDVRAGTLILGEARVTGGATDANGGGIRINTGAGLLTYQVEVSGNTAAGSGAGGIHAENGGTVRLISTLVAENTGGIGGVRTAGQLVADNLTVSANTGTSGTGGIAVAPGAPSGVLNFTTITDNTGGGYSGGGVFATTIVANQASGSDCATAPATAGYNLDSDGTCLPVPATGDKPNTDPLLLPLEFYDGERRTHLPPPASPVIDQVPVGVLNCGGGSGAFDQRGMARPSDTDLDGTPACEIGATENNNRIPGGFFEVATNLDAPAATAGDGRCEATPGGTDCTLRAALEEINTWPLGGNVFVYPGPDMLLTHGSGNDRSLVIKRDMWLTGSGQTIDAGDEARVVYIDGSAEPTVALQNLTLTGGHAKVGSVASASGGGLLVDGPATVGLTSVGVLGNHAANAGGGVAATTGAQLFVSGSEVAGNSSLGLGGGILLAGGSSASVTNSSIDSNAVTVSGGGGGIAVSDSSLELRRSSIVSNAGVQQGGGLRVNGSTSEFLIEHSTISSNASPVGAGVHCWEAPALAVMRYTTVVDNANGAGFGNLWCSGMAVEASIVGAQQSGPSCGSQHFVSLGYNVEVAGACGFTHPTDAQHTDPELDGALGMVNGTIGHPLLPTSPVLGFIPPGAAGCGTTDLRDQQSILTNRPTGVACEPGALEYQP
ncbi:MAG: right-handed parallel beta-helix repeat-containing protein [Acidimicrobiia bacterium]|nr:right-handed parallel beta-helix repeat-containing protein [Acidimicrobiia bacterium]